MRVVSKQFGIECPYLTEGKEYKVETFTKDKKVVFIKDDTGKLMAMRIDLETIHTHSKWNIVPSKGLEKPRNALKLILFALVALYITLYYIASQMA